MAMDDGNGDRGDGKVLTKESVSGRPHEVVKQRIVERIGCRDTAGVVGEDGEKSEDGHRQNPQPVDSNPELIALGGENSARRPYRHPKVTS